MQLPIFPEVGVSANSVQGQTKHNIRLCGRWKYQKKNDILLPWKSGSTIHVCITASKPITDVLKQHFFGLMRPWWRWKKQVYMSSSLRGLWLGHVQDKDHKSKCWNNLAKVQTAISKRGCEAFIRELHLKGSPQTSMSWRKDGNKSGSKFLQTQYETETPTKRVFFTSS